MQDKLRKSFSSESRKEETISFGRVTFKMCRYLRNRNEI